jgi:c-di-GMP-binding flagellar brake protein YcgR
MRYSLRRALSLDSVDGGTHNYTRVPIKSDVTCPVGPKTMRGVSWNLSQGGMQLEVGGLRAKDEVRVSFRLPVSGEVIDPVGTVVWGNQERLGIQFTKVSEQNQQSIWKFIGEVERMDAR